MNLNKFLNETDKTAGTMSKAQLQAFVHEYARILPEGFRGEYLDVLQTSAQGKKGQGMTEPAKKEFEFEAEFERIHKQLCRIAEGELCLGGELNYEYDDWYDDDDEEFLLRDPDGIVDIVDEACQYVRMCVDHEEYAFGFRMAEKLMELEIYAEIDDGYDFYDTLGIGDLEHYGLGNQDWDGLVTDGLYCAYHATDMDGRPGAIYNMIEKSDLHDIRFETVMQTGTELEDINEFLPKWIAFLGGLTTWNAQRLLAEALELVGDEKLLLDSARQYYDLHPSLYERYLDGLFDRQAEGGDIFGIGDEALEKIKVSYVVRSRIAKKLSLLALKSADKDRVEGYWMEAFRSETNVTNFMRIFMESSNSGKYLNEIRKIYRKMYKKDIGTDRFFVQDGELETNRPDIDNVYMLAFFGGEFQYVRENAMNKTVALGWSSTFMKCGLAAFLLLLYEDKNLQNAMREMCQKIVFSVKFDKDDYEKYAGRQVEGETVGFFWQCFLVWKEKITIKETEKQEYIKWLDGLIRKRVDGIMQANRRNYYRECASYIAAFGEMLQSRGERSAKQRVLEEYKNLYVRRSAFRQELRNYGLIEQGKGKK